MLLGKEEETPEVLPSSEERPSEDMVSKWRAASQEESSPQDPNRLASWSQSSLLQIYEKINFWGLSYAGLGHFVMAIWEDEYNKILVTGSRHHKSQPDLFFWFTVIRKYSSQYKINDWLVLGASMQMLTVTADVLILAWKMYFWDYL